MSVDQPRSPKRLRIKSSSDADSYVDAVTTEELMCGVTSPRFVSQDTQLHVFVERVKGGSFPSSCLSVLVDALESSGSVDSETSAQVLGILSDILALDSYHSSLVLSHFRPVILDLVVRWIRTSSSPDVKWIVDRVKAFGNIVFSCPHVKPIIVVFLRMYGDALSLYVKAGVDDYDFCVAMSRILCECGLSVHSSGFDWMLFAQKDLFSGDKCRYVAFFVVAEYLAITDAEIHSSLADMFQGPVLEEAILFPIYEEECRIAHNQLALDFDSTKPLFPWNSYGFESADITQVGGVLLLKGVAPPPATASQLVITPRVEKICKSIAVAVSSGLPVIMWGPSASGKSEILSWLANYSRNRLVTLHLDDSTDFRSLVGTYVCTDIPGEFKHQDGLLTICAKMGYWLVIENIDRAPADLLTILSYIISNKSFPSGSGILGGSVHANFKVFGTAISDSFKFSSTRLLPTAIEVRVDAPSIDEIAMIAKYIHSRISDEDMGWVLKLYASALNLASLPAFRQMQVTIRQFLRLCKRADTILQSGQSNSALRRELMLAALSVFASAVSSPEIYESVEQSFAETLYIPEDQILSLYNTVPQVSFQGDYITINSTSISRKTFNGSWRQSTNPSTFAFTKRSVKLLEQLLVAVHPKNCEPLLLVGETGTGKTTTVQQMADLFSVKLHVINMSQQSDSGDLMGGFKPVDFGNHIIAPIRLTFDNLFKSTFSVRENMQFLETCRALYTAKKWKKLMAAWKMGSKMAVKKADGELLDSWCSLLKTIERAEIQFKKLQADGAASLAFGFVEGTVVRAIRDGHWILLDEINLATSETLQCLTSLLESPTGTLLVHADDDLVFVKRHPAFRIFACMNPSTDVGKRDLPPAMRDLFTEIWVPGIDDRIPVTVENSLYAVDCASSDFKDLFCFISRYMENWNSGADRDASAKQIATFHCILKYLSTSRMIYVGSSRSEAPHFSLRTLARSLMYARKTSYYLGVMRAIREGLLLSYCTSLEIESIAIVDSVMFQVFPAFATASLDFSSKLSADPAVMEISGFLIDRGVTEESSLILKEFVVTPSVAKNMRNLARAVSAELPVLLQGPTSTGKTSVIEYMAALTGNRFVRINNHEHTDLQEYLGSYSWSEEENRLVFCEGILVKAVRSGWWIVLDELNLAPSEVLEALNRLLDDNKELLIPETGEVIKPSKNFRIFATQNPAGSVYGGRKFLSRAFRNRFVEIFVSALPNDELKGILERKCEIAPSYAKKLVAIYQAMQRLQSETRLFTMGGGLCTLRDLFRWANRHRPGGEQALGEDGYMLLAERLRKPRERQAVKEIIEKHLKCKLNDAEMYFDVQLNDRLGNDTRIVWTKATKRLFRLVDRCIEHNEPILLVGGTGSGKTSMVELISRYRSQRMHSVNCHYNSESSDFVGSMRPCRTEGSQALFSWQDGPLMKAMRDGDIFLLDEISLAESSVLERLNSVLEPSRVLVVSEKGIIADVEVVNARSGFQFAATMNPGGDFGKKELSPAFRSRFTEIWVNRAWSDADDICLLMAVRLDKHFEATEISLINERLLKFLDWYSLHFGFSSIHDPMGEDLTQAFSLRDLYLVADFLIGSQLDITERFFHAIMMVFADAQRLANGRSTKSDAIFLQLIFMLECAESSFTSYPVVSTSTIFSIGPFVLQKIRSDDVGPAGFVYTAPTAQLNAMKLCRALSLPKPRPILMEGSPGVGKTALVISLARQLNQIVVRVNLSDQTDIMDLFGSDVPCGVSPVTGKPMFSWKDGPMLRAMKSGHWILLDELNLATQPVLEGLNACLDHRSTVFIPELNKSFQCHPHFRVFGAQNPMIQGGGRKGLPQSFLNRFVRLYLEELTRDDMKLIAAQQYSSIIPADDIDRIVSFNHRLSLETQCNSHFAKAGSPWEFNLRDITRWLDMLAGDRYNNIESQPSEYLEALYLLRFRESADRDRCREIFAEVFASPYIFCPSPISISPSKVQVGKAIYPRLASPGGCRSVSKNVYLLSKRNSHMHALIKCVQHNLAPIVVGPPSSGKATILKSFASICNKNVVEIALHESTDASDLIGSYEQVHGREFAISALHLMQNIVECLLRSYCGSTPEELLILHRRLSSLTSSSLVFESAVAELEALEAYLAGSTSSLSQACSSYIVSTLAKARKDLNMASMLGENSSFAWKDAALVDAIINGEWVLIRNCNRCSPAVLDRLNSLFEKDGNLELHERASVGESSDSIVPHPDFRVFFTVDSLGPSLSRALRNRGVELVVEGLVVDSTSIQLLANRDTVMSVRNLIPQIEPGNALDYLKFTQACVNLGVFGEAVDQPKSFSKSVDIAKWPHVLNLATHCLNSDISRGLIYMQPTLACHQSRLPLKSAKYAMALFRTVKHSPALSSYIRQRFPEFSISAQSLWNTETLATALSYEDAVSSIWRAIANSTLDNMRGAIKTKKLADLGWMEISLALASGALAPLQVARRRDLAAGELEFLYVLSKGVTNILDKLTDCIQDDMIKVLSQLSLVMAECSTASSSFPPTLPFLFENMERDFAIFTGRSWSASQMQVLETLWSNYSSGFAELGDCAKNELHKLISGEIPYSSFLQALGADTSSMQITSKTYEYREVDDYKCILHNVVLNGAQTDIYSASLMECSDFRVPSIYLALAGHSLFTSSSLMRYLATSVGLSSSVPMVKDNLLRAEALFRVVKHFCTSPSLENVSSYTAETKYLADSLDDIIGRSSRSLQLESMLAQLVIGTGANLVDLHNLPGSVLALSQCWLNYCRTTFDSLPKFFCDPLMRKVAYAMAVRERASECESEIQSLQYYYDMSVGVGNGDYMRDVQNLKATLDKLSSEIEMFAPSSTYRLDDSGFARARYLEFLGLVDSILINSANGDAHSIYAENYSRIQNWKQRAFSAVSGFEDVLYPLSYLLDFFQHGILLQIVGTKMEKQTTELEFHVRRALYGQPASRATSSGNEIDELFLVKQWLPAHYVTADLGRDISSELAKSFEAFALRWGVQDDKIAAEKQILGSLFVFENDMDELKELDTEADFYIQDWNYLDDPEALSSNLQVPSQKKDSNVRLLIARYYLDTYGPDRMETIEKLESEKIDAVMKTLSRAMDDGFFLDFSADIELKSLTRFVLTTACDKSIQSSVCPGIVSLSGILCDLVGHLEPIMEEYLDHPILLAIKEICSRMLKFDSSCPEAKFAVGLELLWSKLKEWQIIAPTRCQLPELMEKIESSLVALKRAEISEWSARLDITEKEDIDADLNHWHSLHRLCFSDLSSPSQFASVVECLRDYIASSRAGVFAQRLKILFAIANQMAAMPTHCNSSINSYLFSVYTFHAQYLNDVADFVANKRSATETSIKDQIKILEWKGTDFLDLKKQFDRAKETIRKYVKEYRDARRTNVSTIFMAYHSRISKLHKSAGLYDYVPLELIPISDVESPASCMTNVKVLDGLDCTAALKKIAKQIGLFKQNVLAEHALRNDPRKFLENFKADVHEAQSTIHLELDGKPLTPALRKLQLKIRSTALVSLIKNMKAFGLRPKRSTVNVAELLLDDQLWNDDIRPRQENLVICDVQFSKVLARFEVLAAAISTANKEVSRTHLERGFGMTSNMILRIWQTRRGLFEKVAACSRLSNASKSIATVSKGSILINSRKSSICSSLISFVKYLLPIVSHHRHINEATWSGIFIDASSLKDRIVREFQLMSIGVEVVLVPPVVVEEMVSACRNIISQVRSHIVQKHDLELVARPLMEWKFSDLESASNLSQEVGSACDKVIRVLLSIFQTVDARDDCAFKQSSIETLETTWNEACAKLQLFRVQQVMSELQRSFSDAEVVDLSAAQQISFVYDLLQRYLHTWESTNDAILTCVVENLRTVYFLINAFNCYCVDGFCLPDVHDEADGDDQDDGPADSGTGMAEGVGEKDVSNEIEDEEQVLGLENEKEPESQPVDKEEDGLEMDNDFEGTLEDVDQPKDGDTHQDDDDKADSEDEMGDLGDATTDQFDSKFWGSDNEDEAEKEQDLNADSQLDQTGNIQAVAAEDSDEGDCKSAAGDDEQTPISDNEDVTNELMEDERQMDEDEAREEDSFSNINSEDVDPDEEVDNDMNVEDVEDNLAGEKDCKMEDVNDTQEPSDVDSSEEPDEEFKPNNPYMPDGNDEDIEANAGEGNGESLEQSETTKNLENNFNDAETVEHEQETDTGNNPSEKAGQKDFEQPRELEDADQGSQSGALAVDIKNFLGRLNELENATDPTNQAPEDTCKASDYQKLDGPEEGQAALFDSTLEQSTDQKELIADLEDSNDHEEKRESKQRESPMALDNASELPDALEKEVCEMDDAMEIPVEQLTVEDGAVSANQCLDAMELEDGAESVEYAAPLTLDNRIRKLSWDQYVELTQEMASRLCEGLRTILEPTKAAKLSGGYRSGKKLDMKRIIPYIASNYKKDKIWMKRTKLSSRDYKILIAIDDSKSMLESKAADIAIQSVAMVTRALTQLEVGELAVARFGSNAEIIHPFSSHLSSVAGEKLLETFTFSQPVTDISALLETSLSTFEAVPRSGNGVWKFQIIISDGLCDDHERVRRQISKSYNAKIVTLFVMINNPAQKSKLSQTKNVKFINGKLVMRDYMDTFPFDLFVVIDEIDDLPDVMSHSLKQWFECTQEETQ